MPTTSRVLIVDDSHENRAVLSTLLERCGALTLEAGGAEQAVDLMREHRPDLIVYDAESDRSDHREATTDLGAAALQVAAPVVVLGTARRQLEKLPTGQFVAKPYHYGPLIRRIEDLLGTLS